MGEMLLALLQWLSSQGAPVWTVLAAVGLASLPVFLVWRRSRTTSDDDIEERRLSDENARAFARTNLVAIALTSEIARLNADIAKLSIECGQGRAAWEMAYRFRRMLLIAGVAPLPDLPLLENILPPA